jgi:hypothetical protein
MLDRIRKRSATRAVVVPRFMAVSTSVIVPIAVVCAATGGFERGAAATAGFAGVALALAGLFATAVRLVVMDWLAEIRSRAAWFAVASDHYTAAFVEEGDQREEAYPAAVLDATVRAALRVHRQAVAFHAIEPVPKRASNEGRNDTGQSQPTGAQQFSADVPVGHLSPPRPRGADISGAALALDRSGICADAEVKRGTWKVVRSSAPVTGAKQCKRQIPCGFRLGARVRRIVNAGAGTWKNSGATLRVIGIPIKIASNIVVVGEGEKGPSNGEASPGALLDDRTIRAGPPASIAGATASSRDRHRRSQKTSIDLTAVAEARRRVIALAEALARQAAREDDAAEHLEEHSRSPPDMAAVEPPRRGAKDDTT